MQYGDGNGYATYTISAPRYREIPVELFAFLEHSFKDKLGIDLEFREIDFCLGKKGCDPAIRFEVFVNGAKLESWNVERLKEGSHA
jgi:hypothetical protein